MLNPEFPFNRRSKIYLRYLCHDRAPLIETIAHALEDIFQRQSHAFKINLSFPFILQHRETGEFRYQYASNNNQVLNSPRLIRNQQDLENLLDHLAAKDLPSHLKDQHLNTKWVIERIVSLRIHLVMTIYPLGNPPKLPDYINPIWTGLFANLKRLGGAFCPPPNFAISSQKRMKLGKGILRVEIFTN